MKRLLLPGAFAAISLVIALAWGQQPSLAVGGPPFGRTAITPATLTVHPSLLGPQVNPSAVLGAAITTQFNFARAPIPSPMASAGLKNSSFPGGEMADRYHFATNTTGACNPNGINPSPVPAANFDYWMQNIVQPNSMTPAVQVNYGSNAACSAGGDPTEAAAWVTYANTSANNSGAPYNIVWWVIGRGQYAAAQSGTYNTDLHPPLNGQTCPGNPVCYVNYEAAFYNDMHTAATATGIPINVCLDAAPQFPNTNWDLTVLKQALYDCVAVNFYPENTNQTGCNTAISDSYLVKQAANCFTNTFLNQLLNRLSAAGRSGTPIYVSEIGSVESSPGPQSESITSSLYAGQMIGEMLNDGINLGTWNNAYSACNPGPFTPPTPYSWQDYGSLAMFSAHDPNCDQASSLGTLQANANAYLNASHFVRAGETMLGLDVSGNQSINAYASTYNGSYAVMIFNTHPKNTITTTVAIDGITSGGGGDIYTYGKAEYDNSQNEVWSPPTHTSLGSWSTNFSLSLAPWSMTVVVLNGGVLPTPTPSPTPTPALVFTPSPLPSASSFGEADSVTVSQPGFLGTITFAGCAQANVAPASANGPTPAPFTVTALANGTCTLTISGGGGQVLTPTYSVNTPTPGPTPTPTPGPLTVAPNPVPTFVYYGPPATTETITELNYIGSFGESDTCSGIATISTISGPGPTATFTVTPNANGTCNITITGYLANSAVVPVTVSPTPSPTPPSGAWQYMPNGDPTKACQVFGSSGHPDPIINADLEGSAADPVSATVLGLINPGGAWLNGVEDTDLAVNIADSSTLTLTPNFPDSNHRMSIWGPNGFTGGPGHSSSPTGPVLWQGGTFLIEALFPCPFPGTLCMSPTGTSGGGEDHHLSYCPPGCTGSLTEPKLGGGTQTIAKACMEYFAGGTWAAPPPTNGIMSDEAGAYLGSLTSVDYGTQVMPYLYDMGGNGGLMGIPFWFTGDELDAFCDNTDATEANCDPADGYASAFNHPIESTSIPAAAISCSQPFKNVNYSNAGNSCGGTSCTDASHPTDPACAMNGDAYLLKSSYICPTSGPMLAAFCESRKHFPFVQSDVGGSNNLRYGMDASLHLVISKSDIYTWLHGSLAGHSLVISRDFYVVKRCLAAINPAGLPCPR